MKIDFWGTVVQTSDNIDCKEFEPEINVTLKKDAVGSHNCRWLAQ